MMKKAEAVATMPSTKKKGFFRRAVEQWDLQVMVLPGILLLLGGTECMRSYGSCRDRCPGYSARWTGWRGSCSANSGTGEIGGDATIIITSSATCSNSNNRGTGSAQIWSRDRRIR